MNAGNVAEGSTPSSRTIPVVKSETVRTSSTCLTAQAAMRSANGLRRRRVREPYNRVAVRQSPCTSRITFARLREKRRAITAEAASCAPWTSTASGSNSRSNLRIRNGSDAWKNTPSRSRGRSGGTSVNSPSLSGDPVAALASTCTSSAPAIASNLSCSEGGSGSL